MTEQEKIEQAAKDHARQWHKDNPDEYKNPDASPRVDFLAGASFYAKEVMPGIMVEFAEWATEKYVYEPEFKLYFTIDGKSMVALVDIVNEFLEQSKQKDNGNEANKT